jgi:NAD(P)-dependent dehydrogenase (short-subunit alcohol dehydrogenase family)
MVHPFIDNRATIHFAEYSALLTLRPTMKSFDNKTVLITGGNSGIGKAAVLAFAKEGANVVISGRRVAEGEKLAKEITSGGGSALFVRTDVGREDDIVALVEKTVGTFGALHIAFNNAGTEGQFGHQHSRRIVIDEARDPRDAPVRWWCYRE